MVKLKSLTIITWVSINCIVQADRYTKPLTENCSLHCFKPTIFVHCSSYEITLISDSRVNLYTYQKLIYIEKREAASSKIILQYFTGDHFMTLNMAIIIEHIGHYLDSLFLSELITED